jgi:hypothetical protein
LLVSNENIDQALRSLHTLLGSLDVAENLKQATADWQEEAKKERHRKEEEHHHPPTRGEDEVEEVEEDHHYLPAFLENQVSSAVAFDQLPPSSRGDTALIAAVRRGNATLTRAMAEIAGADVDVQGSMGRTPLIVAVCKEDVSAVELLLRRKANVNLHEEGGDTALHKAASAGRVALVRTLIRKGGGALQLHTPGSGGMTAGEIATVVGHPDITALINASGAPPKGGKSGGGKKKKRRNKTWEWMVELARFIMQK